MIDILTQIIPTILRILILNYILTNPLIGKSNDWKQITVVRTSAYAFGDRKSTHKNAETSML